jgi:hypothetical protein
MLNNNQSKYTHPGNIHCQIILCNKARDFTLGVHVAIRTLKMIGNDLRVGRVLSFFSGIGTPPTPHPQASVPPPHPLVPGKGHTSWRERGYGRVPCNSDEGTYTVVLYICVYVVK